jgi:hypothetical protein
MKKVESISIDKLSIMFNNLRTASNILSAEAIGFEDQKERIAISEENKAKLKNVYDQVDILVNLQAQHLSLNAQLSLFDENGKAIESGYTREVKLNIEDKDSSETKLSKEKEDITIGPKEKTTETNKINQDTIKNSEKEIVNEAKKPEDNKLERLASFEEAKTVIFDDISNYVKTNKFDLKKDRLPMDLRTALCIKLKGIVPEDHKLATGNDSMLKSMIGNVTTEVKNAIAKERMTDGNKVAGEDKVAEKLAEELKRDEIKSQHETKAKEEDNSTKETETKPEEETETETNTETVESPEEETEVNTEESSEIEEQNTDKPELSSEGDEAEIIAQLIQEQLDSLRTSSDKESIKTAMKDIFVTQETRAERKAMSDEFSAILNKRTELFPDENDVYDLIIKASYAAKEERELKIAQ